MSKYKSKPVTIEAFQWTGNEDQSEDPEWFIDALIKGDVQICDKGTSHVQLATNYGGFSSIAVPGNYLVLENDLIKVLTKEQFEKTYEKVEMAKSGDIVRLIKLSDEMFNGHHPNAIYNGHTVTGQLTDDITIGEPAYLDAVTGDSFGWFHTSKVTEIIDDETFKTKNSTYHIEKLDR